MQFFKSRSFLTSPYSVEFSKRQDYRLSSNHITLRWWTNRVGFANYPIASLFNQVDIILGGKLISSATNTYAHRSILEVLLCYDKEAAESQLGCGLFCKDTAGQMEEMEISADPVLNTGLGTRSEWTKTSKTVELQGRIHSDLFNQENLL